MNRNNKLNNQMYDTTSDFLYNIAHAQEYL